MRHARAAPVLVAVLVAALAAGCGRPLLSAQLEVPEVRITEPDQQFDPPFATSVSPCAALPPDCRATSVHDVGFDLGDEVPFLEDDGVDVDLHLTGMTLHFGGTSSRGLQELRAFLVSPGGAPIPIASWERPPGSPQPVDVVLATASGVNLASYLAEGVLTLRVELEYDGSLGVPSGGAPVAVDVTAAFSVEATVDYTKM
jgi:hypothetical protein